MTNTSADLAKLRMHIRHAKLERQRAELALLAAPSIETARKAKEWIHATKLARGRAELALAEALAANADERDREIIDRGQDRAL